MWKKTVADMGEARASEWAALWDPLHSLPALKVPILWLTGTNDRAFSLPALMKSYISVSGEKHLSLKVGLEHTHGAVSEQAAEVVAFADSMCKGGRCLADFAPVEFSREIRLASCKVRCDAPPKEVWLVYTDDAGESWEKREWKSVPAKFDPLKKRVEAVVPESASSFFFNVITVESLVSSSEIVEKP